MSAADVTKVREEVQRRLRADYYRTELKLEAMVTDTMLDVLDPELEDIGPEHRLIVHLVCQGLKSSRCEVCRGSLIGRELGFGTCGHCGGRSIQPLQEVSQ